MIKSYLEFKQVEQAIKLAEDTLMRPLTDDEKEMVIVKGFRGLMESLEVDQEDWLMLQEIKKVITAYTSGNEDIFMQTLEDTYRAKEFFNFVSTLYNSFDSEDYEEGDLVVDPVEEQSTNPVMDAITKLQNGETVELDPEMINKVCEFLAGNFMNYLFQAHNGQASLKVK
jgi:ArsR family metal-binding transcriptional regulator